MAAAVHPDEAALLAISSSLEQLQGRVVEVADRHRPDPDDALTGELDELERLLRAARRRLDRTIRGL